MKAKTLQIHWHDRQPIFSIDFEPCGKGRLATAGGDENIWKIIKENNEPPHIEYLSSLNRHTASVNVVRFSPKGAILASAGDDGNIILWQQSEQKEVLFGEEEDNFNKETWRIVSMLSSDIYDIAWSPDAKYILSGSIDNTAKIWDVKRNALIYNISDHSHFVQGVAWDPLGEYIATQSSDRYVNVYSYQFKKNGAIVVTNIGKFSKMDIKTKVENNEDDKKEGHNNNNNNNNNSNNTNTNGNTMLPPPPSPKRTKSNSSPIPSPINLSVNNSPVKTSSIESTPKPTSNISSSPVNSSPTSTSTNVKIQTKSNRIYHDETLTSFFRRLSFTSDGSLLLTPAGQYRGCVLPASKKKDENISSTQPDLKNTVYIYTRGGLNRLPMAHLPGHKKPAIAVRCNPIKYKLRNYKKEETEINANSNPNSTTSSPTKTKVSSFINLPYRLIYAVATQDSVLIYDTQQTTPLVLLTNLHYATFTDIAWSYDGCTLMLASTDGYCSIVSFENNELGEPYDKENPMEITNEEPTTVKTIVANIPTKVVSPSINNINIINPSNIKRKSTSIDNTSASTISSRTDETVSIFLI
ncbi:WD40 repeat-like protein [Neocallimastix sp. 'constans']